METEAATLHTCTIRALTQQDLDAVVDIDAAVEGRVRRAYFQRRLATVLKQPKQHVQLHSRAQFLGAHDARVIEFGHDFRLPRDEIVADAFASGIARVGKRTAEILADGSAPQPEESIAQEKQQPGTGIAQPQAERVARRCRCCS